MLDQTNSRQFCREINADFRQPFSCLVVEGITAADRRNHVLDSVLYFSRVLK
jgi:hypothetical protein